MYIDMYSSSAKVVAFCSVVPRTNPMGMAQHEFRELANAFNAQLRMRLANFPHLIFWAHRHLDRYLYRSDGRHFESGGELRFYLSVRRAVKRGQRMFASLFP